MGQALLEGVPKHKRHPKSSHASCTPATDGKHLVTFFGSEGLYCHDLDGKKLWKKDLGLLNSSPKGYPNMQWGFASSPIIHDNKVIVLEDSGDRRNFKMNRKCAAGTGAFLEEIAAHLGQPLSALNDLAGRATGAVELGSFCTVFAKTELLKLIAQGTPLAEIVKAAFRSVTKRILEMDPLTGQVVMTGGVVAHNPIIVELVSDALGRNVLVPHHPQYTGALGAALVARDI